MSRAERNTKPLAVLRRAGWRVTHGSKHHIAWPPDRCSRPVPIPHTMNPRVMKNLVAQLRRSGYEGRVP